MSLTIDGRRARAVIAFVFVAVAAAMVAATLRAAVPATGPASGQDPPQQPTFRTRSEGVRVDVLVLDGEKPVAGLKSEDFELRDSNVRQTVEATAIGETPLDVILVLDTSTSLGKQGLAHLTHAADTLFTRLKTSDRAALVTFSEDVQIRAALTPQHARVRAMLKGLALHGTTSVIDAAYTGMILTSDSTRPTLLLVFSDGFDTASWLSPAHVIETARRAAVVPYAVVTGAAVQSFLPFAGIQSVLGGQVSRQQVQARVDEPERFLFDLVGTGGGLFLNADSTGQIESRFEEALDSFRQRYVLTYVPQGVEREGWHPVSIRIKGKGYRVRARPGYFVR